MKPYTRNQAESDLQAALDNHDQDTALAVADQLDHMPPPPGPSTVGAALWYATRGLPVFPIQPGAKTPYPGSHGCKDATTDPGVIAQWWGWYPDANVAIATGHRVDVIDFDGAQGHIDWGHKYPTWDDAEVTILGTVSTPRPGGMHVYVPATGAGNRAGYVGKHVDYRGLGGYVLVPPSRTEVGPYRWLQPLTLNEVA